MSQPLSRGAGRLRRIDEVNRFGEGCGVQRAVSVPRLFLPVVGNGLKHDAKLGDEQCGEHQEEEGEGDLHVRHRQTGHGCIDRQ